MARIVRVVVPDCPHHVLQRGLRRMDIFFSADDNTNYELHLRARRRLKELDFSISYNS
jgi:hypothetical protein